MVTSLRDIRERADREWRAAQEFERMRANAAAEHAHESLKLWAGHFFPGVDVHGTSFEVEGVVFEWHVGYAPPGHIQPEGVVMKRRCPCGKMATSATYMRTTRCIVGALESMSGFSHEGECKEDL